MSVAYKWHFEVVRAALPLLLRGIVLTVEASVVSMGLALVLAFVVALARVSQVRALRGVAYAYTEFFRNTPLLMQILWIYYALPLTTGLRLSAFYSGVAALVLSLTAFVAEIYRAGIISIGAGQRHAGLAIGMTQSQLYRRIILPQALARVIPPLGSLWVSLFKDTSILSVIGVAELMDVGRVIAADNYRPLEIFTVVAVLYYVLGYPQALAVNHLYHRLRVTE